jgi:hypothetical protein
MAGTKVRVIAAQGATLRGPAVVKLTAAQHGPRSHVLGPWVNGGRFSLDGHQKIALKYGEELVIEEAEGRLNKALFENLAPPKAEKAADPPAPPPPPPPVDET